ncbi:hypothetical protein GOP47_0007111 [Adiantum capillus-veneris]|uniref:Beta-carotene isomerase D27-like C-terminal domain-containing protein n=1 Tax=Adiantum capillus-veneris TaxID=13818 RepID=A0A9D4ZKL0_ADICA|nr:hypothetical protein GOP47_0007111 [Adiantum capillus-veneris]
METMMRGARHPAADLMGAMDVGGHPPLVWMAGGSTTSSSSSSRRGWDSGWRNRRRRDVVVVRCGMVGEPAPFGHRSRYSDSPYDLFCINRLAQAMSHKTGLTTNLEGYDALIDISRQLASSTSPKRQREIVLEVLPLALPLWMPHTMRWLLRPSKLVWEFYAFTTPLLFQWLVGPVEVKETHVNGVTQKSVVHIKKCRYLENSNCVGMCMNLCKIPSERFIKQEFGVDVAMIPNFEDMSCDMIFGQAPIPLEQDPAMSQPCYKALCMNAEGKDRDCPKVPQPKLATSHGNAQKSHNLS